MRTASVILCAVLVALTCLQPRRPAAAQQAPRQDPQTTPEQEDALLRSALSYVRLSRAQIGKLLLLARQADRRRVSMEAEETPVFRALQGLPNAESDEAFRLKAVVEQHRGAAGAKLVAAIGPMLTRVLSREQIALLWRLEHGKPPKYAHADPALLEGAAGFASQPENILRLRADAFILKSDEPGINRLDVAEIPFSERLDGPAAGVQLDGPAAGDQGVIGNAVLRLAPAEGPRGGPRDDPRPFPQRVVEEEDPAAFLPELDPIIRRLFLSPRWLPILEEAFRSGVGEGVVPTPRTARMGTLRPVRDYRMERGFANLLGPGPELQTQGGQLDHGRYVFQAGQGVVAPDTGVTDHYALQLIFTWLGGDGYQKLIDFKDGTVDGGLYTYQGRLTFYTDAVGGIPVAGQEHRLVLERNRKTRIVRAYLDWRPIFAFLDLDDEAVFDQRKAVLFADDRSTKDEQGPGVLRSLSFWAAGPAR